MPENYHFWANISGGIIKTPPYYKLPVATYLRCCPLQGSADVPSRYQCGPSKPPPGCASRPRSSHPFPARPASGALASALRRPPRPRLRRPSCLGYHRQLEMSSAALFGHDCGGGGNHDSVAIQATIFTAALHNPPKRSAESGPPARSVRWVAEACREGAPHDEAEGFVQGPCGMTR